MSCLHSSATAQKILLCHQQILHPKYFWSRHSFWTETALLNIQVVPEVPNGTNSLFCFSCCITYVSAIFWPGGGLRSVVANVQSCDIVVIEFELRSCYYFHFSTNPLSSLAIGWIVPLLFFYKGSIGIRQPSKVDMPLNKEIKPDFDIFTLFLLETRDRKKEENFDFRVIILHNSSIN